MTKREAIEQAYGKFWDIVKNHIDKNGWFVLHDIKNGEEANDLLTSVPMCCDKKITLGDKVLPRVLDGIENNRGWIKIESEDDLPKESGEYFTIYENDKDCFVNSFYDNSWNFNLYKITHYQPITKPEPPIY